MSAAGLLLAVESATSRAEVALWRDGAVVARVAAEAGRHHSETLLPLVDEVLAAAGAPLDAVAACAVSIGPGAFTSLRIGVATVKGLCFGADRPVVPVPTLEALAEAGRSAGWLGAGDVAVPTLDARRGEVYAAAYRTPADPGAPMACVLEAGVFEAAGLAVALPGGGRLLGEGAGVVGEALDRAAPGAFDRRSAEDVKPSAEAVARLGAMRLARGEAVPAARLVPRYVRRAEAEVLRTAQRFE